MKYLTSFLTAMGTAAALAGGPVGDEWENNQKLSQGREPTRAAFSSFKTCEQALDILPEFAKDRQVSLDSDDAWRFNWAKDPESRPKDFWKTEFDVSAWPVIKVPCSWQAMGANGKGGWGTALYTNVPYPYQKDAPGGKGVVTGEPPKHFTAFGARNPVGSYRRDFELPAGWQDEDIFLKFDGVDSFFYLWVNGAYVGFSKDSRSPAEFNVTPFVRPGRNTVALEVYRYSDGAYLEDQDMFRLSGIFRRTWLIRRPAERIRDFFVTARPAKPGDFKGRWEVSVEVDAEGEVKAELFTFRNKPVAQASGTGRLTFTVDSPDLWSAEAPNCYKIVLSNGKEFVSSVFGFRVSEMREVAPGRTRYFLNGQPIKLKGANRHESDPMFGHFVPMARHEQDMKQMKEANCNTVRNAHYPQDDYWYYLCDTKGLYVVDEANVESHGYGYGGQSLSHQKVWEKATVDRNLSMVERNKNHPSVVIWSYGNEAGPGENFQAVQKAIKARDVTRPTHYERDWSVADMDGCQYPAVDWCWWKAKQANSQKPFYISEYAHNMANAMGNLKDYQDAIESSDVILGATIWDWVDQGLWLDKNGVRILAFGGDFGDQPNDGLFCMNGCVLSDRNLEPGYFEIKHVYQNWTARASDAKPGRTSKVIVRNKNYFVDSSGVRCVWELLKDGRPVCKVKGAFDLGGLGPMNEKSFELPARVVQELDKQEEGIVSLRVAFRRGRKVIADDQIDFPAVIKPFKPEAGAVEFVQTDKELTFIAGNLEIAFCRKTGMPHQVRHLKSKGKSPVDLLKAPMKLDAYRSPSSNEVSFGVRLGDDWAKWGLADLVGEAKEISEVETLEDGSRRFTVLTEWKGLNALRVQGHDKSEVKVEELPTPSKPVTFYVAAEWTVHGDGTVACRAKTRALGRKIELARLGFSFELYEVNPRVKWFGRGPFENYRDRKSGAFLGYWKEHAEKFFVPYARNEDCGNREDTYGFQVGALTLRTLGAPFAFEVNPYTPLELLKTVHPAELPKGDKTFVGVFAETRGLGGQSCGPAPMPRDVIRTDRDYDLAFTLDLRGDSLLPRAGAPARLPALPEAKSAGGAKIVLCSSSEPGEGNPDHLLDGDLDTIWHTQYTGTMGNFPHLVAVELPKVKTIRGLKVWGRPHGENGRIRECEVETSVDGQAWTLQKKSTLRNTGDEQQILFLEPVQAKFYRFTAKNNHHGNDFASMAEIEVIE